VAAGVDPGDRPIRLTVRDALILQGFPPDYPVQGSRSKQFEQVGNAVPPPLAAHIIAALTGAHYERNVT
jgi:DNA (cytosine-5)-methyltransferase 1